MFYFKQFKTLFASIKDLDPAADAITDSIIRFVLPDETRAVVQYVHQDFDDEGDSEGSVYLTYDGNKTEFDCLRYAIDGIEALFDQRESAYQQILKEELDEINAAADAEPTVTISSMSADDLASDLVQYLYDHYNEAAYIGDKELADGSIALRIDWGKVDKKAAAKDLKNQYGDRITFINTRAEYAPEFDASGILVYPPKSLQEAVDSPADNGNRNEMTEDGVQRTIESLGLEITNKWYDGNKSRPVFDCKAPDGTVVCVWNEPPYEARVWVKDANPRDNGLVEAIITLAELKTQLGKIAGVDTDELDAEQEYGNYIDTAMMDHYDMMNGDIGDFESTGFGSSIKALCEKAGQLALAEAVMKLYAVCKPVTEAVDLPQDNWRDEYGEQGLIMSESSADGFFAKPNDPIGFAILNNDVATLQKLHDGTYVADEPYNVSGFSEDLDNEGQFNYNFEEGYHQEFEEDWERVVGETDNQEALRIMLQYVPDFWLCSIDFWNAFKAGYDKKLLARLLSNYPAQDDPYNNYLPWEDVSFDEVMDFLSEDSSVGSPRPMKTVIEAVDVPMQIFADYLDRNNINELDAKKLEIIISKLILGKKITSAEGDEIYHKIIDNIN